MTKHYNQWTRWIGDESISVQLQARHYLCNISCQSIESSLLCFISKILFKVPRGVLCHFSQIAYSVSLIHQQTKFFMYSTRIIFKLGVVEATVDIISRLFNFSELCQCTFWTKYSLHWPSMLPNTVQPCERKIGGHSDEKSGFIMLVFVLIQRNIYVGNN